MIKRGHIEMSFSKYREALADNLVNLGILELGEFELKRHETDPGAAKSPFKINLRTKEHKGPLIPDAVEAIAALMFYLIERSRIKFDLIAGIPQAGEPFAEIIADLSGKPLLKLKKEVIDGRRRITSIAEGKFSSGQTVLLVDDVLSFGESKEEAIMALRRVGLVISDLLVFIDREEGGRKTMESFGCNVHSAFFLSCFLQLCLNKGRISSEKHNEIIVYINSVRKTH